jgi:hypothetical protein
MSLPATTEAAKAALGTVTVSWTGMLTSATFYVETTAGTGSFTIDDVSFR